jgi:hypothetical protein
MTIRHAVFAALTVLLPTAAVAQDLPPPRDPPKEPEAPPPPPPPEVTMLLGADLQGPVPLGNFGEFANFGVGILPRYEYLLTPTLNLTGFIYHFAKEHEHAAGTVRSSFWEIPLLAGVKYAFTDALYAAGELGMFLTNGSTEIVDGGAVEGLFSDFDSNFGLTLGGGYRMGKLDFRVGLHVVEVQRFGDTLMVAANVGYNFWQQ